MSYPTKALDFTSKIAVTCLSSLLMACEPLLFGGVAGFAGSSSSGFAQCATGPADLSGVCRSAAPTMGALEVLELEASADALNITSTATLAMADSTVNISWSPYPGTVAGYYVYYGPTAETATTLISDLVVDALNFNAFAPSVSYQSISDLGLSAGNTVCFRIIAYDTGRVPYSWSEMQCTVV